MRLLTLIIICCCCLPAWGQNESRFQVGTAFTYDYGVQIGNVPGYTPYGTGRAAQFSFDVYVGIPLLPTLNLYPSFIYSIPARSHLLQPDDGDFLPLGYSVNLPYNENGPDTYYSHEYKELTSYGDVWQRAGGAFVGWEPFEGFEIGSGLFLRSRTLEITDYLDRDAYDYAGSTDTTWDHYSYAYTTSRPTAWSYSDRFISVPIYLGFRYDYNAFFTGASIIRWLAPDGYWSFRYTMGIAF